MTNIRAKQMLDWQPGRVDETLKDSAEGLFQFALAEPVAKAFDAP